MPEFVFGKVVHHQGCNFIKKRLQHRCFTVNFAILIKSNLVFDIPKPLPVPYRS